MVRSEPADDRLEPVEMAKIVHSAVSMAAKDFLDLCQTDVNIDGNSDANSVKLHCQQ